MLHRNRYPVLSVCIAFVCVATPSGVLAEPAGAEPHLVEVRQHRIGAKRHLSEVKLGGVDADLIVWSRNGGADTADARALIREAEAMHAVLPGYPQPAIFTVSLRISY